VRLLGAKILTPELKTAHYKGAAAVSLAGVRLLPRCTQHPLRHIRACVQAGLRRALRVRHRPDRSFHP
jgi:hypothetical protein